MIYIFVKTEETTARAMNRGWVLKHLTTNMVQWPKPYNSLLLTFYIIQCSKRSFMSVCRQSGCLFPSSILISNLHYTFSQATGYLFQQILSKHYSAMADNNYSIASNDCHRSADKKLKNVGHPLGMLA